MPDQIHIKQNKPPRVPNKQNETSLVFDQASVRQSQGGGNVREKKEVQIYSEVKKKEVHIYSEASSE